MSDKALTVRQPWAHEIINGYKNVENRHWKPTTPAPFRLWIHAAKLADANAYYKGMFPIDRLPVQRFGAIVGFVTVTGWHESSTCGNHCSQWAMPFRWHWNLARAHAVNPTPCRGSLGLWTVPADVLALIP